MVPDEVRLSIAVEVARSDNAPVRVGDTRWCGEPAAEEVGREHVPHDVLSGRLMAPEDVRVAANAEVPRPDDPPVQVRDRWRACVGAARETDAIHEPHHDLSRA